MSAVPVPDAGTTLAHAGACTVHAQSARFAVMRPVVVPPAAENSVVPSVNARTHGADVSEGACVEAGVVTRPYSENRPQSRECQPVR